jgi:TadE-like protein
MRRRPSEGAQGMVEFAILLPLLLFVVFAAIDVGRVVYTYNAISSAAREGARLVALTPQKYSDCDPLHRMELVGQAFPLVQDPQSVYDFTKNIDPNTNPMPAGEGPTPGGQIPLGYGYIYIYPAVANSTTDCTGPGRPCPQNSSNISNVAVAINYRFVPLTPLISNLFPNTVVRTISVVQSYCS